MKPYQTIAIADCGEPLVPIPAAPFPRVEPHPYLALGAPYGERSPYWLRQGVLAALEQAQQQLQTLQPGWRLQIFDAFRPVAVQRFMVQHSFLELIAARGLQETDLDPAQRQAVMDEVHQFWAMPSPDPATPPPHSTGAAIDLTLVDTTGTPVDMGSPIDELSPRSYPDHFAIAPDPHLQQAHRHRTLLYQVMAAAGFARHPKEWWHFSLGDQLWAWQRQQATGQAPTARYGGVPDAANGIA